MAIPEIINTIHAVNREKAGKGLNDWREPEDSLRNNILKRQTQQREEAKEKQLIKGSLGVLWSTNSQRSFLTKKGKTQVSKKMFLAVMRYN